jgi:uncharacterized RDD family membrane protein YckC
MSFLARRRAQARGRVFHTAAFHPPADLDGVPLATPGRRVVAFLIDALLVLVPSIVFAIAASLAATALREPVAFDAMRTLVFNPPPDGSPQQIDLLGRVAPVLARMNATNFPAAATVAVEEGDLTRAGRILAAYDFHFAIGEGSATLQPQAIRVHLDRFIPDGLRSVAFFGVAAVYFTVLTAASRRTVGKRLTGTRVVKLDGQPLTMWESFERFGGYFAALGTFGLGLRDLWHEPNGRLAHDKLSNTVVLSVRVPEAVKTGID